MKVFSELYFDILIERTHKCFDNRFWFDQILFLFFSRLFKLSIKKYGIARSELRDILDSGFWIINKFKWSLNIILSNCFVERMRVTTCFNYAWYIFLLLHRKIVTFAEHNSTDTDGLISFETQIRNKLVGKHNE